MHHVTDLPKPSHIHIFNSEIRISRFGRGIFKSCCIPDRDLWVPRFLFITLSDIRECLDGDKEELLQTALRPIGQKSTKREPSKLRRIEELEGVKMDGPRVKAIEKAITTLHRMCDLLGNEDNPGVVYKEAVVQNCNSYEQTMNQMDSLLLKWTLFHKERYKVLKQAHDAAQDPEQMARYAKGMWETKENQARLI
ncbi:MAG: hypothetical protein Q9226_002376 [Calogaya cf. arnoldii]